MTQARRALLIEDDVASLEALERLVQRQGFETRTAQTLEQAIEEIEAQAPDLAVLDLDLPDGDGSQLIDKLQEGFETEIVIVTGTGSIDSAVETLHAGVSDYFTKPLDTERFLRFLAGVGRTLSLRREVTRLRSELRDLGKFDSMVGATPAMQQVYSLISKVARTDSTVLVTGETGTGKDLVARTVHDLSLRSQEPFVAVNCGAVQESLIESELFGHERGAFTGAASRRKGIFEQAQGGTVFLDEITEMPADLQVKLLRVLESRSVRRVGGERSIDVDVRLIAATNRAPEEAVEAGKLRKDLFYRLRVFPIHVPPLRERTEDVALLATYFLRGLNERSDVKKRFDPAVFDVLASHDWPGNVRELQNAVERAFILAGDRIRPECFDILADSDGQVDGADAVRIGIGSSIADAERALILATLEELGGDKKKASRVLGISLKTLYTRLNSYGLGRSAGSKG